MKLYNFERNSRLILFVVLLAAFIAVGTASGKQSLGSGAPGYNTKSAVVITPTCLDRSSIPSTEYHWLHMPVSASELYTNEDYTFLAGQLIKAGVVDASDCPLNGVWYTGYANACGMEKSRDIVLELQNTFDDEILQAGIDVGVPPVMLKQLIRYESQFWPVRYQTYHFGLGHLTLIGASTVLQWNADLYYEMCELAYNGECPGTYTQYFPSYDNILAGQLLSLLDASCPDCPYTIDIQKAEASIGYIAKSLMSYCKQTSQLVFNATGLHSSYTADYALIWKLTLLNYNAGPSCVYNAVYHAYASSTEPQLTWGDIGRNTVGDTCLAGVTYVNNITAPYYNFTTP